MKWYETIFLSIGVSFFTTVSIIFITANFFLKTADVVAIISEFETKLKEEVYEGKLSPEDAEKIRKVFLRALENSLKQERGVILARQATLKGGFKDVTQGVKSRAYRIFNSYVNSELIYKGGNK